MLRLGLVFSLAVACMPVREPTNASLSSTPMAEVDLASLLAPVSDYGFSGYYLDIEKTMAAFRVSRFVAHEVQNRMRDSVEVRAQSFSILEQKPYVLAALADAVDAVVKRHEYESGFAEMTFAPGDFVIALDLDETLLSHWYKYGTGVGSFQTDDRDVVPEFVDRKTGNSKIPVIQVSPSYVQMRPGVKDFMARVARVKGFRGFIIFTAKEDKAALSLYRKWAEDDPDTTSRIIGLFARNHLRFDATLQQASKDLRIFDPSLQHVFLVDDNEGRVMQKSLCYKIPKFNADSYLNSTMGGDLATPIKRLNDNVLPYVTATIEACAGTAVLSCLEKRLGEPAAEDADAELKAYLAFTGMNPESAVELTLAKIKELHVFEPGFHPETAKPTSDSFPEFQNFRLVNAEQLKP